MTISLNGLSNRQLQLYAAACLRRYCNDLDISHPSIDQLIAHLIQLSLTQALPDWEQRGLGLEIVARGDPIPHSILQSVPDRNRELFSELVEYCVEVGIVDLYCNPSDRPERFVHKCIDILRTEGMTPPSLEPINSLGRSNESWGDAYDPDEIMRVTDMYSLR